MILYPLVLYGLQYSWLTLSDKRKLDAWQARILRRTLGIKASMISHITNADVLKQASTTPITTQFEHAQIKYFGHILRAAEREDISYTVCFSKTGSARLLSSRRRHGHPCDKWTNRILETTYDRFNLSRPFNAKMLTTLANSKKWQPQSGRPRVTPRTAPHNSNT